MLLRTVVRLTEASGGSAVVDKVPVGQLNPVELRRKVALVQQNPAMLEGSVLDNIAFGLSLAGVEEGEVLERARGALADASLDDSFLKRRAEKLSGGERQRVAIARALAMRPVVLLLDEPTATLDPRSTKAVERTILRLKEGGRHTMVVVTHDIAQAGRLGDRTILLRRGRVVASGDSGSLMEDMDPEERERYLGELERWEEEHEEDGKDD
jgi:ABC-type phosphate transport system ATPase subunit